MFARLNAYQNDLLVVQVVLDCIMVSIAVGMLIGGAFGMHVYSGLETMDVWVFWTIGAIIIVLSILIFLYLQSRFRLTGIVPLLNSKQQQKLNQQNKFWRI